MHQDYVRSVRGKLSVDFSSIYSGERMRLAYRRSRPGDRELFLVLSHVLALP